MWMVRAGESGFLIDRFEKENRVVIGWEIGDLTNVNNSDEIKTLVKEHYPHKTDGFVNQTAAKISKFRFDVQKGDYVISPDPSTRIYLIGKVTSDYIFDDEFYPENPLEYCDIRKVRWLGKVYEIDLSGPTKKTLRTSNTIFRIKEESCNEILTVMNQKKSAKWVFAVNKQNFNNLINDDITWNSALEVKKDDLILFYKGEPESAITDIFIAKTDPYDDPETKDAIGGKLIDLHRIAKILDPPSWKTLKNNSILKNWAGVKMQLARSHFKTSDEEWNELKRLILEKNLELAIILGEPTEKSITKYLKKIFRSYVKARENRERVNGHELSKLFNNDFPNLLKAFANVPELSIKKHIYDTSSGYHARGVFITHPWILLYDKNTIEKDEKGNDRYDFYVVYIFNEDMSGFHLSLNIRGGYANHIFEKNPDWDKNKRDEYLKSCASKVREKLENKVEIPLDFQKQINGSPWWTTTILGKYYDAKGSPSENELQDDLKRILKIYNSLIEDLIVPKPYKIIQTLFNEFKTTYLPSPEGIEHTAKYDLERQKVQKYFEIIKNDENAIYDFNDPSINHLLPIKQPAVAPVAVGDIKAYGYKNEELPGLTISIRKLIDELDYSKSREILKDLITEFKNSKYKTGFQTAMFTPTLYYLKPDFWFINKKTVVTYNLFSELVGDNETITGNLIEYIDNNDKVHALVNKLEEYIPELYFEKFDAFCHWMSSESWGNYANDEIKFHKWLVKNGFEDNGIIQEDEYRSFSEFLTEKNFLYTPETVENFLLSLKVKPFIILTGNSGTGKTKIAQLFAEYLEIKNKGNYQIIPVGANWTENRHLIGFYNVIIQDYQTTPSLELLLNAVDDEDNPYFMILDEMNLSHVERYFADFLSAMESGENIPLHSNNNGEKELIIPEDLEIPQNVFVVGTVNVDETTYMFSPKVLDRANTIEFSTYPAKSYILGEFKDKNLNGDVNYLENPLSNPDIRKAKVNDLKEDLKSVQILEGIDLLTFLAEEIQQFQETLSEAGFDFGFRVIDEILRFMYVAWVYEKSPTKWINWRRYFDAQIMQKMLPKIHGSQRELDVVLENLFKLCYNNESDSDIWYLQELHEEYSIYPTSAKKLQWMGKTLQEKRFVSFTN